MPKLTKRTIDAAEPKDDRYFLWDTEVRGFGLSVAPTGTKSYFVRYRPKHSGANGPKRFQTIGRHGTLTPDQARDEAKAVLREVACGADPAKSNAATKNAITLQELGHRFLNEHVDVKNAVTTRVFYRGALEKHVFPQLGKRVAASIKRDDIAKLHLDMRATPFMANRVIAIVASLYSWAGKSGLVSDSQRPTLNIDLYKEEGRERYLTSEELERLGQALEVADIDLYAKAAVRLLLLTACRLREILHLKWENVDLERGRIYLQAAKAGKRAVFVSGAAATILQELPRSGLYVISSPAGTKPRADLKRPWATLLGLSGLEGVRLHDLRHTHASVGAAAGLSLQTLQKLLGHKEARTTAKYAHLADDPTMQASDAIGLALQAALAGKRLKLPT